MVKVIKALNWRYATKKFNPDKKISEKDFNELLEALRLSPSSYGLQPWKFIVVEDKKLREKLRAISKDQSSITDASHLIVFCARKEVNDEYIIKFLKNMSKTRNIEIENLEGYRERANEFIERHSSQEESFVSNWAKRQLYISLGFLLSVCAMKGIDACPIEAMDEKKAGELLGLDKQGLNCVALCALGYRAEDDKYSKLKKVRFSKKEVIEFR